MNWGILATGTIARKFADTVNRMGGEEKLVAVASRSEEKAAAFANEFGIPGYYGSYEAMFKDAGVDAVYIATPNSMHYENCVMCLDAGKNVLCEKPFTIEASQAEKLYDYAAQKGLFIMEAFWIRFLPLYRELTGLIENGVIGDVRHARCEYGFIATGARRERKFKAELGGGALLDIGIYNLGFLHMIMNAAPESFDTCVHMNEYGTDDYSVLQLVYPGGRTAQCIQTIGMKIDRHAAIFGTKGSIYIDDFQHAVSMTVKPDNDEEYTVESPVDINGFEYEIREVSSCVKHHMQSSRIYTPKDSITVLKLMNDIMTEWQKDDVHIEISK